jgi:hypothetical protein
MLLIDDTPGSLLIEECQFNVLGRNCAVHIYFRTHVNIIWIKLACATLCTHSSDVSTVGIALLKINPVALCNVIASKVMFNL